MEENTTSRAEAERLLGIAEKLLQSKDLVGSRDFAVLAQETEPLLEGSDQILAIADVLIAADKRINNHQNWYAVLQLDGRSDDLDFLKKQYRRLALLLHPDKNKFPFADAAFKLVADAWAVLSDPPKKSIFDNEMTMYSRVDLVAMKNQKQFQQNRQQQQNYQELNPKLPVRRGSQPAQKMSSFWTACPYCYNLYEYPRVYQDCCLRCNNCERAIHAVEITTLPPLVPGKDAYYCCWGFFPMGFTMQGQGGKNKSGFPNWMPPMFGNAAPEVNVAVNGGVIRESGGGQAQGFVNVSGGNRNGNVNVNPVQSGPKKRGRPRKNPLL